ncbi:MAG: zinc ABC transporter substrate-binding protein [Mycobacterium sp.]|nr:zinc ABC transporter substrate-binding protein [Mycobacterium sp.]
MKTVIITAMLQSSLTAARRGTATAALLATAVLLASCSSNSDDASAPAATGDCPVAPVDVVVSVDQWGDIVSELGGACAKVSTLLAGSSVDPHDYEPTPADAATFSGAQLVVINGGHYDEWAAKLAASSAPAAPVLSAVDLGAGGQAHDHDHEQNPHVWYDPATVTAVADAVTAELQKLSPGAAGYFTERRTAFTAAIQPYAELIGKLKAAATGKTYAATESVFDLTAQAIGLVDKTPAGFAAAAANETDPAPADLDAFLRLLDDKGVDVLIYNTQTEGTVPEQVRAAAEAAGVPVVNVTETVAPGAKSFEAWQVDQLTALAKALGVSP